MTVKVSHDCLPLTVHFHILKPLQFDCNILWCTHKHTSFHFYVKKKP